MTPDDAEERPLLGMLHGKPVYEFDWPTWCNPSFCSTFVYVMNQKDFDKIAAETLELLGI